MKKENEIQETQEEQEERIKKLIEWEEEEFRFNELRAMDRDDAAYE